jgi:hypothetical protein
VSRRGSPSTRNSCYEAPQRAQPQPTGRGLPVGHAVTQESEDEQHDQRTHRRRTCPRRLRHRPGAAGRVLRVIRGRYPRLLHRDPTRQSQHQPVALQAGRRLTAMGLARGRRASHPPRDWRRGPRGRVPLQGRLLGVAVHGGAAGRCAGLRVPRGRGRHGLIQVPAAVHRLAPGPPLLQRVPGGQTHERGRHHPHRCTRLNREGNRLHRLHQVQHAHLRQRRSHP